MPDYLFPIEIFHLVFIVTLYSLIFRKNILQKCTNTNFPYFLPSFYFHTKIQAFVKTSVAVFYVVHYLEYQVNWAHYGGRWSVEIKITPNFTTELHRSII